MVGRDFMGKHDIIRFKNENGEWVEVGCFNDDAVAYEPYIEFTVEGSKIKSKFIKNEEEKEMNKVLELWYESKREKIIEKYDTLEREYCTKQYGMVEDFNNLVNQFNEDLEELYKFDKESCQNVLCTNAPTNVIKYKIDYDKLGEEFKKQYGEEREEELKELARTKYEVEAQLSLSNDLKYTQEVLERYSIINKKTKKISE